MVVKMRINSLYTELKSLEALLNDSVNLFIRSGKIRSGNKDFQIFIEVGEGSFLEKIKVIFKHKRTVPIIGHIILPSLFFAYGLLSDNNLPDKGGKVMGEYAQEI